MTKGILVTQSGIDASQALDSQKVLDSRWRYYEIYDEIVLSLPTLNQTSGAQIIYTHNLGYLPAFDVYDTVLSTYIDTSDGTGNGLVSDTKNIYFNGFYNDRGWSNHKVVIRIYKIKPTETYNAPIDQTLPSKVSAKTTEGIKIVDGTESFHDLELSKYNLSTTSKSLAIQATGMASANSGTNYQATITHNLGYPPTFLATYVDNARNWISTINPDLVPVKSTSDQNNLVFSGVQSALGGTFVYIIFKELGEFAL